MRYLLLELVVMNIGYVSNVGCSNWGYRLQRCIKLSCRIPFICIGMQSSYEECTFWAIFGWKSAAWQSPPMRGTFLGHIWPESAVWQSPPMRGIFLDHIWSKSAVWQSPPMRGTLLDHIWLKSTAWQRPPMRGIFLGCIWSKPLCDNSSNEGHNFLVPHLAKVHCLTKSSKEGQKNVWSIIFGRRPLCDNVRLQLCLNLHSLLVYF